MAIILDIPVEPIVIKDKGANVTVYKFRDFWRITETDVQSGTGVDMTGLSCHGPDLGADRDLLPSRSNVSLESR